MTAPTVPGRNALDVLLEDDDAHHVEVSWKDGAPVAYATVDGDWDEIAVYDDCGGRRDDRDPEVLAAILVALPPVPDDRSSANSYPMDRSDGGDPSPREAADGDPEDDGDDG